MPRAHVSAFGINMDMTRTRPRTVDPQFQLSIWRKEGQFYSCDRAELEKAMADSEIPPELIASRMGQGFHHLADALAGKRLDRWSVAHIETGLAPVGDNELGFRSQPTTSGP